MKATKAWLPDWTRAYRYAKETEILAEEIDYRQVANDLRKEIQENAPKKSKVGKGAFLALSA